MLVLEINNLKKYYGNRLIIDLKNLKVYKGDRIGIVGLNGSGKTTLLNLISKDLLQDEGSIKTYGNISYIKQLDDDIEETLVDGKYLSKLNIRDKEKEYMSGGEITRLKIAKAFSENPLLLLCDEPTSNLDLEGIDMLIKRLTKFDGAMLIVSHDRNLLDRVCNKIISIEKGYIKIYEGNYSEYKNQKDLEIKTKKAEYEKYIRERDRLKKSINETKNKSKNIRKTPKRMGISEARLHKMGNQKAKKHLDSKAKALKTKLEKLEKKEKVEDIESIKIDILGNRIHSKVVIEGHNIYKSFKDRVLFKKGEFQILNGSKTALIGKNGCGKTTLLNMILDKEECIKISKKAKIGYFSQNLSILDEDKNILENVMNTSIYDEMTVRTILARFLFKRHYVYKKIRILSGGERVKVSIVKILMSDFNILILDEPTNYLDIYSIEALEKALVNYKGTVLFVSHDRRFIEKIADNIMYIEDNEIKMFNGTLKEFENSKEQFKNNDLNQIIKRIDLLEYRLTEIVGKLSMPSKYDDVEALDKEYNRILKEIRDLKNSIK